jgi:acetyl esterase/lipase
MTTHAYGTHSRHELDVYERADSTTVIMFWHGGSWTSGDKKTYRFMARAINTLGYTAVLPNYRLAPEVQFPAFVEDAALAVRWVHDNLHPDKLILMGHSAGAYMPAVLSLDDSYLRNLGLGHEHIDGFIGLAGPYDFNPYAKLRPIFERAERKVWNPVHLVERPTVPMLLLHGALDTLVAVTNSRSLANEVVAKGGSARLKIYPYLEHFSLLLPPLARFVVTPSMRREIQSFVKTIGATTAVV